MAENSPYEEESEQIDSVNEELLILLLLALKRASEEDDFDSMQETFQREVSEIIPTLTLAAYTVLKAVVSRTERELKLKGLSFDFSDSSFMERISSALTDNLEQVLLTNENMYTYLLQQADLRAWPQEELTSRLKRYYGLTPTHTKTVLTMEDALAREGAARRTIKTKTNQRIEQLVDWRNELIADSVTVDAIQGTKEALFRYFLDTGQVNRDYVKQWVAVIDDRTSDICLGLNGQEAELDGVFTGGYLWPPAHGHCRSSIRLVKRST